MTKSDRLKTVTKVADERERQAAREMGAAQQTLAQRQQRLKELQNYRDEYARRFSDTNHDARPVVLVNDYRLFMHRLDQAVVQQQRVVDVATAEYEKKRASWMALRAKAKALDKVVDKLKQGERRVADRKEQKDSDERAGRSSADKAEKN